MTVSVSKRRLLIWVGWPLGVCLFWLGVYLNIQVKHGGGIYWAWNTQEITRDFAMLLVPPLVLDWLFVRGRNNG